MSSSSLSMVASSKLSNLYSHHSLTHLATHFPPFSSKPNSLKLKLHNPTSLLFSLSPFPRLSATSDSYHFTEETQEYPDDDDDEEAVTTQEEEEPNVSRSGEEARLYVGNLPYTMTSSQLSEVFGEAGRVLSAQIVYDRVTDRSRGFGFITMRSMEEAKEAIRLFDGSFSRLSAIRRYILCQGGERTIKGPKIQRGGERDVTEPIIQNSYRGYIDSPHKIYAGNLGWGLSSQGLREVFADQPGLLSAKVIYERDSGRSRGFGFVSFETAEDAESALNALNGVEVEGRPLRLNVAAERASSPPSTMERNTENSLDSSELLSSISS
ncbi:hypothetical protein EZV62_015950 [Acer yangbiense]|uniref:RRM domain-containing protein n=1 Tax=Acer yangbiense TaxID=1000413 RepID=A0A5C7HM94_9ROSI|nr:hypothetical protein EZV62_015950 [Acer yangbiense]